MVRQGHSMKISIALKKVNLMLQARDSRSFAVLFRLGRGRHQKDISANDMECGLAERDTKQ